MEIDKNHNVLFIKSFPIQPTGYTYTVNCVDAIRDNQNNYYALINWQGGSITVDNNTTINNHGTLLVKISPIGNILWYYNNKPVAK